MAKKVVNTKNSVSKLKAVKFNRLKAWLNSEVEGDMDTLIDIVEGDKTESAKLTLSLVLEDEKVVTVDTEGYVRDELLAPLAEGKYKLLDGNVLVIDSEGKFVGTEGQEVEQIEPIESEIAQEDETDELEKYREELKALKEKVKGTEGKEKEGLEIEIAELEAKIKEKDDEFEAIDKIQQVDEEIEVKVEDGEKWTVEIDGKSFDVDKAVYDYITLLEGDIEETKVEVNQFKNKYNKLKSRQLTANPVSSVQSINQSKEMTVEQRIAQNLQRLKK